MAYDRKVQGAAKGSRQQGLAQAKMLGAALARQKGQEETETTRHADLLDPSQRQLHSLGRPQPR